MSNSNPSVTGRRSTDHGILGRQDSSAADGPFSPAGLKVLVVDDDPMCLKVVSAMLQRCNYQVVTQSNGQDALALLRQRQEDGNDQFDLVLSDVYMPDMDGFRLLEAIALELELPVIMMSSDGDTNVVLRGVTHGAVDFLIKPVRIEELRNVWQHVVRRRSVQISRNGDDSAVDYDGDSRTHGTKRKETETLRAEHESVSGNKKPRVVWSVEMHQQFVNAVNVLGIDKAVPKRILDLMNVEGLTRENVASHLQKYRLYLKRVEGVQNGKGGRIPKPPIVERMTGVDSYMDTGDGGSLGCSQQAPTSLAMQHQNQHHSMHATSLMLHQQQQGAVHCSSQPLMTQQQAVPPLMPMAMAMAPPGAYAGHSIVGTTGPIAAAQMAAAWQHQQAHMQAAAASGALPAAPVGAYIPHPAAPFIPPSFTPMQTAGLVGTAPFAGTAPSSIAPLSGPHSAAAPPVGIHPSYPGSHTSLASLPPQPPHSMGNHITNGGGNGHPAGDLLGSSNAKNNAGGGANGHSNGDGLGGGGGNNGGGASSTVSPPSPGTLGPSIDHYPSAEDEALLPSLGNGEAMPEEAPLSESLLHDLPVKHDGDQEFFSIFNIRSNGGTAT